MVQMGMRTAKLRPLIKKVQHIMSSGKSSRNQTIETKEYSIRKNF